MSGNDDEAGEAEASQTGPDEARSLSAGGRIGRTFRRDGEDRHDQNRPLEALHLPVRRQGRRDRSGAEVVRTGDGHESAANSKIVAKGRPSLACWTAEHRYIPDVPGRGFPCKRPRADAPAGARSLQWELFPSSSARKGCAWRGYPILWRSHCGSSVRVGHWR